MLRHSVFVVLDGVFFQEEAVPPREIVDVVRDGAIVVGACSMGALRAADCGPAGMRGVGTVYRLFRRGALLSDDEVAVTFDPARPFPSSSLALVSARVALRRAVRSGLLEARVAEQVVRVAAATFYADRRWPAILAEAGLDPSLSDELTGHDVKHEDAVRALDAVAMLLARAPDVLRRPRLSDGPFETSEESRELGHDALGSLDPASARRLAIWAVAGGRLGDRGAPHLGSGGMDESEVAGVLRVLEEAGELDATAFRLRAVDRAVSLARERGWTAQPADRYLAASEISLAHGASDYQELRDAFEAVPTTREWLDEHRDRLALAKTVRRSLFRADANESIGG